MAPVADEAAGLEAPGKFEVGGVLHFLPAQQVQSAHKDQCQQKQYRRHSHHRSNLDFLIGTRHESPTSAGTWATISRLCVKRCTIPQPETLHLTTSALILRQ